MEYFVCIAGLFLILLFLLPIIAYLVTGLKERRNEILSSLSSPAIRLYFKQYQPGQIEYPADAAEEGNTPEVRAFVKYYAKQFGTRHFIIPTILLSAIVVLAIVWSGFSVTDWLQGGSTQKGGLPALAVAAVMGSYMYMLYEFVERWNSKSLSPADLLWQSLRLAVAVPMGYSLTSALKPEIGPSIAFLLGALPLSTLLKIARRSVAKSLDAGGLPEGGDSELLKLNGIDLKIAERLASEEITTALQLAYADPIRLAIRTNLSFTFITDCSSQALLYVYVEDAFQSFRKTTLRSSYEIRSLLLSLTEEDDEAERERAGNVFRAIAAQLGYSQEILMNLLLEIGLDPYTEFMFSVFYQESQDDEAAA